MRGSHRLLVGCAGALLLAGCGSNREVEIVTSSEASISAPAETQPAGHVDGTIEVVDLADPIAVGETQRYVIDLWNPGSAPDAAILVECRLGRGQQFAGANAPAGASYEVDGDIVRFTALATLNPGARATFDVFVQVTEVGDAEFAVSVSSDARQRPTRVVERTRQE